MQFEETQRYRKPILWITLGGVIVIFLFGLFKQVVMGEPFGNNPLSNEGLIGGTLILSLVLLLFLSMRLYVRIDDKGVHFRYTPFHFKTHSIPWNEITEISVEEYSPIAEYGGWGVRFSVKGRGKAFSVSGSKGIRIKRLYRGELLLGINQFEAAEKAVKAFKKS